MDEGANDDEDNGNCCENPYYNLYQASIVCLGAGH